MQTIADNIRRIAKSKGIKLEEIYTQLGMSNAGFYKMLRNNSYKKDILPQIAKILNILPWDLEEGVGEQYRYYTTFEVLEKIMPLVKRNLELANNINKIIDTFRDVEKLEKKELIELLDFTIHDLNINAHYLDLVINSVAEGKEIHD